MLRLGAAIDCLCDAVSLCDGLPPIEPGSTNSCYMFIHVFEYTHTHTHTHSFIHSCVMPIVSGAMHKCYTGAYTNSEVKSCRNGSLFSTLAMGFIHSKKMVLGASQKRARVRMAHLALNNQSIVF